MKGSSRYRGRSRTAPRQGVLPGSTLAEVLVMMIVAGVVFMAIADGLGLLRRYTNVVAARITANSRFYDGYTRLDDILSTADSVTSSHGETACWRGGAIAETLLVLDSLLILHRKPLEDTLMHGVRALRTVCHPGAQTVDTLLVVVRHAGRSVAIPFLAARAKQVAATAEIRVFEKGYEYE